MAVFLIFFEYQSVPTRALYYGGILYIPGAWYARIYTQYVRFFFTLDINLEEGLFFFVPCTWYRANTADEIAHPPPLTNITGTVYGLCLLPIDLLIKVLVQNGESANAERCVFPEPIFLFRVPPLRSANAERCVFPKPPFLFRVPPLRHVLEKFGSESHPQGVSYLNYSMRYFVLYLNGPLYCRPRWCWWATLKCFVCTSCV